MSDAEDAKRYQFLRNMFEHDGGIEVGAPRASARPLGEVLDYWIDGEMRRLARQGTVSAAKESP